MNRRPLILAVLIAVVLLVATGLAGSLYYTGKYLHVKQSQIRESTRVALYQTQTQAAITPSSTSTLTPTYTPTSTFTSTLTPTQTNTITLTPTFTLTPSETPSPTFTLTPTIAPEFVLCDAIVVGTDRALYPIPSLGHRFFNEMLELDTELRVYGKLADWGWYKVDVNGDHGWMRTDHVFITGPGSCKPNAYDLHFLLDQIQPDDELILEDTFAKNTNIWINSVGEHMHVDAGAQREAQLEIMSTGEDTISTTNPKIDNISNFRLLTSFTLKTPIYDDAVVGIRFRDNGMNYYQVDLSFGNCQLVIKETEKEIFSVDLNQNTCLNRQYDLLLSVNDANDLVVQINGFDPISINLPDSTDISSHGRIKIVVFNVNMLVDYLVVTALK